MPKAYKMGRDAKRWREVVKWCGWENFEREKIILWKFIIKLNLLKKYEKYCYFSKFLEGISGLMNGINHLRKSICSSSIAVKPLVDISEPSEAVGNIFTYKQQSLRFETRLRNLRVWVVQLRSSELWGNLPWAEIRCDAPT